MGTMANTAGKNFPLLAGKPSEENLLERLESRYEDNIQLDATEKAKGMRIGEGWLRPVVSYELKAVILS
jgi:hypothetical protein